MSKGTHAALPCRPLFSSDGAVWGETAPSLIGESYMTSKAPSHESDQVPDDEQQPSAILDLRIKGYVRLAARLFVAIKDHGPEDDI